MDAVLPLDDPSGCDRPRRLALPRAVGIDPSARRPYVSCRAPNGTDAAAYTRLPCRRRGHRGAGVVLSRRSGGLRLRPSARGRIACPAAHRASDTPSNFWRSPLRLWTPCRRSERSVFLRSCDCGTILKRAVPFCGVETNCSGLAGCLLYGRWSSQGLLAFHHRLQQLPAFRQTRNASNNIRDQRRRTPPGGNGTGTCI